MRILAIRGRNLASLAGDFEVDFRSAPLAAAGIFAICGPTGSGKSTLLDALCLALYNETPRLARSHTKGIELPDVGSETMTPADPRSVLRRGCTEGFAEVDFEGCDGVACRARWSVRRARGRASGKLQQSEMTIERIGDGQRLGDQKREVLDEIQKRVGLTFDQFTRAVLLAQNEFASFLQADDNDRAELLERLTGTERFSELSKRAFERAKAEVAAVTTLERRIEGEAPLAEEQRASLVENHRAASEECEALQREIDELQGYLRWHEDGARLAEKEDQAGTAARDAHERVRLTQPDRDRLARVEEARAARPLLAGLVREEKAEASAVAQAAERRKELEDSAASKEAAERTLEAAERAAQDACSARDDAKTEIDKARELDGTLAPLRSEKETRERGLEKLRAEKNEAENAQAEAAARLRTAKERQERAGRWIEEHERIRPIAESWALHDNRLVEAADRRRNLADLRASLDEAERLAAEAARQAHEDAGRLEKARAAEREAKTKVEQAVEASSRFDREAIAQALRDATSRITLLASAAQVWERRRIVREQRAASEAEKTRLAGEIDEGEREAAALKESLAAAAERAEQAEQSLRIFEAACAQTAESLRESLEEGEPCPVCGACEHPYAGDSTTLRKTRDQLTAERDRLRSEHRERVNEEAQARATLDQKRKRRETLREESVQLLEPSWKQADADWRDHPVHAEAGAVPEEEVRGWLESETAKSRARWQESTDQDEEARRAADAVDRARRSLEEAQGKASAAQAAADASGAEDRGLTGQTQAARDTVRGKEQELASLLDSLDALAGLQGTEWRSEWEGDPAAFHQRLAGEVRGWTEQVRAAEDANRDVVGIEGALPALQKTAEDAAGRLTAAESDFREMTGRLEATERERRNALGGRPVAEVEASLRQEVARAERIRDEARRAREEALRKHTEAETRASEAAVEEGRRKEAREGAQKELDDWLRADPARPGTVRPADRAELATLLVHDEEWIASERERFEVLDRKAGEADVVLDLARSDRRAHEAARPDERTSAEVGEALEGARSRRKDVNGRRAQFAGAIEMDDRRRETNLALRAELETQRAQAHRWGRLSDLIGSSNGDKFRKWAQRTSLRVLLAYANRHLRDLAPRYRLELLAGCLSFLVVDQDMGNERRSVQSLSGGESFLVSLALALGLASLSSHRVRVESLFIDEGFGSLDAETLEIVMQALDRLQAVGRKVGVISHVQEMSERIGAQVRVRRLASGRSRVEVAG